MPGGFVLRLFAREVMSMCPRRGWLRVMALFETDGRIFCHEPLAYHAHPVNRMTKEGLSNQQ